MGLGEPDPSGAKKKLYDSCLSIVRQCANQYLKFDVLYLWLPREEKRKVFAAARLAVPCLARYENDWATDEMLRRYYSPRRRRLNRHKQEAEAGGEKPSSPPQIPRKSVYGYKDDGSMRTIRKAVLGPIQSADPAEKALYEKYVAAVRVAAAAAGITYNAWLRDIPRAQLAQTISIRFTEARELQPGLAQYENDWLTRDLLRAFHSDKRRDMKNKHVPLAPAGPPELPAVIPKPPGCDYKGYALREVMGLGLPDPDGSKKALFKAYVQAIHYAAHEVPYDFNWPVMLTPPAALEKVYAMAQQLQPTLARYEGNWASRYLLQSCVASRRRFLKLQRHAELRRVRRLERSSPS
ncbi:hypothetical protein PsYK624_172170 [Phanerochaete sordida]|uniref:Uncharacterized protein n=1 Tax=Phanerochaete sordida TaxID=48140 RepID=A0A9P3GST5_9APHY|nr:hypothetical protein PsYK624_172170 [Phanerochaete sordida]